VPDPVAGRDFGSDPDHNHSLDHNRGPDPARVLGFLFDPNRCTGCSACSLACSTENQLGWGRSWRQVVPFNPERRPGVPAFHLSLACNHCDDAPCVAHCPTGAMRRDPRTGSVVVDEATCIGCTYCSWVCPFDAPRFDTDRGVMGKCTLCNHRLLDGLQPACVEACPTDALGYGALTGPAALPGFPEDPISPRIRFTELRRGAAPPETTWSLDDAARAAFAPGTGGGTALSFRAEWPLWLFTTGLAGLVAWVLAAAGGGPLPSGVGFAAVAGLLLLVSTLHLGKPARAWRALANVRTSRLSREIAGVNVFLGATLLAVTWASGWAAPPLTTTAPGFLLPGAAAAGLLALFLVDRVYDPVRPRGGRALHSADTLLTGPLVAAALLQALWPFVLVAVLKGALYATRRHPPTFGSLRPAGRIAALAVPPLVWVLAPDLWPGWALLLVAAGEGLDRAAFYEELSIRTPALRTREAAAAWGR
jgi:DMSO reductase iron-sulfur subunit